MSQPVVDTQQDVMAYGDIVWHCSLEPLLGTIISTKLKL